MNVIKCESTTQLFQSLPHEIGLEIITYCWGEANTLSLVCKEWNKNVDGLRTLIAKHCTLDPNGVSFLTCTIHNDYSNFCPIQISAYNALLFELFPELKEDVENRLCVINEERRNAIPVKHVFFRIMDYCNDLVHFYSQSIESKIEEEEIPLVAVPVTIPELKMSDLSVFEVKEHVEGCFAERIKVKANYVDYNEQLENTLRNAIDVNDLGKVELLFKIYARYSSVFQVPDLIWSDALYRIERRTALEVSCEVFARLIRDVPPEIYGLVLDNVQMLGREDLYRNTLLGWNLAAFPEWKYDLSEFEPSLQFALRKVLQLLKYDLSECKPFSQIALRKALQEGDLEYANVLAKIGIEPEEQHVPAMLYDFIKKIEDNEAPVMPNCIEFFKTAFACGIIPGIHDLSMVLRLGSISDDLKLDLVNMFLIKGNFSSEALIKHYEFLDDLFNTKIVYEVLQLMLQTGFKPTDKFLSDGIDRNALSVGSIQLCLETGVVLSEEHLLSLCSNLVRQHDEQGVAKLQLFITAGIPLEYKHLFPLLRKKVLLEVIQFVCDQGVRPKACDMIMALSQRLSLEHIKVLVAAGGPVAEYMITHHTNSTELRDYLNSVYNAEAEEYNH